MLTKRDKRHRFSDSLKGSVVAVLLVCSVIIGLLSPWGWLPGAAIGASLVSSVCLMATTRWGAAAWLFWGEARLELRKVVWPSREETIQSTVVVMLMVLAMSLLLWGIDAILVVTLSRLTV